MRKRDEVLQPHSCLNKAGENEMLFVLLGRDLASPVAIRAWIVERIRTGRNVPSDVQITDALRTADIMEKESKP